MEISGKWIFRIMSLWQMWSEFESKKHFNSCLVQSQFTMLLNTSISCAKARTQQNRFLVWTKVSETTKMMTTRYPTFGPAYLHSKEVAITAHFSHFA